MNDFDLYGHFEMQEPRSDAYGWIAALVCAAIFAAGAVVGIVAWNVAGWLL